MQIPANARILVADGRKMLFFRNAGDAEYPNLVIEEAEERINPADRDQKTDGPGSVQASMSSARSSMEEVDFHQQEEDRFAAEAAAMLRQGALANDFESLIVVAPPRTLGELRKHYHQAVQDRLIAEFDKDLAGHPVVEIEKALAAA